MFPLKQANSHGSFPSHTSHAFPTFPAENTLHNGGSGSTGVLPFRLIAIHWG